MHLCRTKPRRIITVLAVALLFACRWALATDSWQFTQVEMAPLSALQLGDAALVSPEVLDKLAAKPGQAAMLSSGEREVETLLYPIGRAPGTVSIKKSLRVRLGVVPGETAVTLRVLAPSESNLQPIDEPIRIESQEGEPELWPGIVLGAPHGDCDLFTGEVVAEVTRVCGVPSVCAYGSRISFLGRWIDVNRPLQRRPRAKSFGVLPYRDWTAEANAIFTTYKNAVLRAGARPQRSVGEPPLELYFDFHGHDLSVTDGEGKSHYRNVFECMARGFSLEEVRHLKESFDACVRAEYGDDAPASHWGNLPDDREYEFDGMPAAFFYSGLGGRVYGVLNSEVAHRAIHIESPNFMRLDPTRRPRTAKVLAAFLTRLRDDIVPVSLDRQNRPPALVGGVEPGRWRRVPAGSFLMGAPDGEGWSLEWPRHWVRLAAYEIGETEVTCGEYARFVNQELAAGRAELRDDAVLTAATGETWCRLWPRAPLAMLSRDGDRVSCRDRREHHPVNCVTWHGALAMAEANNATLPTEAQWERAAGWDAAKERAFRTGVSRDRFGPVVAATLMNSGNDFEKSVSPATSPIGSYPESRSPAGCLDMSGNVWEWTLDWQAAYEDTHDPVINPEGPESGTMKSVRGGGWDTERQTATPSFRLGVSPDAALPNVGFRLAREAK